MVHFVNVLNCISRASFTSVFELHPHRSTRTLTGQDIESPTQGLSHMRLSWWLRLRAQPYLEMM